MNSRNLTEIPIACCQLNTRQLAESCKGTMLNYSSAGTCIKSKVSYARGTILLIRILEYPKSIWTKNFMGMIRSISLAEVKWILPINENGVSCFGIGLRYLR